MWFDITATKIIQKYLNIYSQMKMHFDNEGKIAAIELFQNGTWITNPILAKRMELENIFLPVQQEASITLKR